MTPDPDPSSSGGVPTAVNDDIAASDRGGDVAREFQPPRRLVSLDEAIETRFVDGKMFCFNPPILSSLISAPTT
jgi:hypothetical protein